MMSDTTYVINTLGRVNKQITYNNLPEEIRRQTFLSVQMHEVGEYDPKYPLIVLPEEVKDLPKTRQWLVDNVTTKYLVIMDDDLSFFKRSLDNDPRKLYKVEADDMSMMFMMMNQLLKQGYPMVGISPREGNNRVPEAVKYIGRSMRIFALDLDVIRQVGARFDRTKAKEDMDMTLQLLRAGHQNAILYHYANDHISSNAPGGCSSYRTLELMKYDADTLKRLHPEFVRVVEKTTKTSWGGATRTDVIVQWKKAYESSQRPKAA